MNIARISPRYAPSVGQEHRLWRQAGCGMTCIYPLHAPAAHEEYGREQAINEIRLGSVVLAGVVKTGCLTVDLDSLDVTVNGAVVYLSATERTILRYLAQRIGNTCTHREVTLAVWDAPTADLWESTRIRKARWHGLRVQLNRLRGRLGAASHLVETVIGMGYVLRQVDPVGGAA